jgi:hypothetical protein
MTTENTDNKTKLRTPYTDADLQQWAINDPGHPAIYSPVAIELLAYRERYGDIDTPSSLVTALEEISALRAELAAVRADAKAIVEANQRTYKEACALETELASERERRKEFEKTAKANRTAVLAMCRVLLLEAEESYETS